MKKSTFKILLFLFLITTQAAFAKSGNFTVIDCNDGDTCRVKGETNKSFKVRLQGIDAPESAQEYGPQAKKVLNDLIKGKKVRLECDGQSFGRDNCTIYLNDKNIMKKSYASEWLLIYLVTPKVNTLTRKKKPGIRKLVFGLRG